MFGEYQFKMIFLFSILAIVILIVVIANSKSVNKNASSPNKPAPDPELTRQILEEKRLRIEAKKNEFKILFDNGFQKATTDLTSRFIFIDFETTDLPQDFKVPAKANLHLYPYIVQAAALVFNAEGELIDEFSEIIKTPENVVYAPEALKVHKISKKRSLEEGVDINDFLRFITKYTHEGIHMIAHNIQFDNFLLKIEAKRNSIKLPKYYKYCTMQGTREMTCIWNFDYTKYKNPKLKELVQYAYFDSEHISNALNFHDAATDIKLCAMCFFELKLYEDCEVCN